MGRTKAFNEQHILEICKKTFIASGYEGTSIDQLVSSTGLLRGSLYSAYGSKRGLFIATLNSGLDNKKLNNDTLDLCLVALLELAAKDHEVKVILSKFLNDSHTNWQQTLGQRLLLRAGIEVK